MPIAKLDKFREDVRQFLEIGAQIQTKINIEYVMKKAPEIQSIWPKVVTNGTNCNFRFNMGTERCTLNCPGSLGW